MDQPPQGSTDLTAAETAYLFRHAVLRDAAYDLQMPGDRGQLHRLAVELIELAFGGTPPSAPTDEGDTTPVAAHATDPVAAELVLHADNGREGASPADRVWLDERVVRYRARLAEIARISYSYPAAVVHYNWLAQHAPLTPRWRVRVLRLLGYMQQQVGARVDAGQTLSQAAELARQLGDPLLVELVAVTIANLWLTGGDAARALPVYEHAVAVFAGLQRPREHANCVMNIGSALFMTGKLQPAESSWNQAVTLFEAIGDESMVGVTLNNRGMARNALGRRMEARADFEQAARIHRRLGNRWNEGLAVGQLAAHYNDEADFDTAQRLFQQALDIASETGNRVHAATVLGNVGNMHMLRHEFARAEQVYRQALELQVSLGSRRSQGVTLTNLSEALRNIGRLEEARATLLESIEIHREVQNRAFEGLALGNLGIWHREQGQYDQSESAYLRGLAVLEDMGHRHFHAIHLCGLAKLRFLQGLTADAIALVRQGLPVLEELRDKGNADEARGLLRRLEGDGA